MPTLAHARMPAIPSAKCRATRSTAGFTLVELMITIGVASILMAIAVPSFNQLIVTSRLTAQANEVVAAMNFARSEAIKRNTSVSFCRVQSAASTNCAASSGSWGNWIVTPGGGNVVRRGVVNTFEGGISVQSTLTGDQVMFGPEGLAYSGGVIINDRRITVCSPQRQSGRRVVLGAGSRMSTQTFTGNCGP